MASVVPAPIWAPAGAKSGISADEAAEPAGRRLLRIGFGLLWIFDGLLQAQPAMAAGLPSQVIEPTAASSPRWVQHVVDWGAVTWSYHPIQAGAAAVWIQVGIGIWLMAAAAGLAAGTRWRDRFRPASLRPAIAAASARSVVSAAAVGVILLGAVPMAAAQASRAADPTVAGSSGPPAAG